MDIKKCGYKYDENGKIIIDEKEGKFVKELYCLVTTYKLTREEVYNLIGGFSSLYQIIEDRITDLFNLFEQYNLDLFEQYDFEDITNELRDHNSIIVEELQDIKMNIKNINDDIKEQLLEKIDNIILLIQNVDNINTNIEKLNTLIN